MVTEGYIDFKLKKYTLLAHLQQVNGFFNENKFYPQLADVIFITTICFISGITNNTCNNIFPNDLHR